MGLRPTSDLSLDGNDAQPTGLAFHRMLARPDADPKALRDLHGRLAQTVDWPFLLDLGGVLDDREAMLAILREAGQDPVYGGGRAGIVLQMETADALDDADVTVDAALESLDLVEIENLLCCDQNRLIEPLSVAPMMESRKPVQQLLEFPLTRGHNEIEVTRMAGRSGYRRNSGELPFAAETVLTMRPE